jgi:hypothetical protein
MKRRTALGALAGGTFARPGAAQHHLVQIAQQPSSYKLRFFTSAQNELLDRLANIIIPADDHSGGAHDAAVSLFIDLMVSQSTQSVKDEWLEGLTAVDREAQTRYRRPFLKCAAQEQDQVVAKMAAHEENPSTPLERYFARLKALTVDGYYTSRVGIHNDLQYQGNQVLAKFAGCTHPEHGA